MVEKFLEDDRWRFLEVLEEQVKDLQKKAEKAVENEEYINLIRIYDRLYVYESLVSLFCEERGEDSYDPIFHEKSEKIRKVLEDKVGVRIELAKEPAK